MEFLCRECYQQALGESNGYKLVEGFDGYSLNQQSSSC